MILYEQDWALHPNAIVHTQTKNKHFVKMHFILKKMGVKNNAFFLSLLNPELADVDPFDVDHLTPQQAAAIAVEAKLNPWYYLRELVRAPSMGTEPIRFRLNRASLFIYWSFFNSVNLYIIQPRQTGKTFTSEALIVNLMYFVYEGVRIKLFTHHTDLIHENVEKFKSIRDELPQYLIRGSSKDTENKEEVKYAERKNTYTTKTSQQSIAGAYNAGRGGTVLVNQIDEMPFCANIHISYPVLMNAKNEAVRMAKAARIPYADLITTTAGRLNTDTGKYAYDIKCKCLFFSEKLYDLKSNAELKYVLSKNSLNNMLYAEYSYRQLGYTKEWADEVIKENNLQGDEILRDLDNVWTVGNERPAIDSRLLQKVVEYETDPVEITEDNGYLFKWYEKQEDIWKNKDRHFVIGLDTSENIDRDFTTVHMLDIADLSTVMTSKCNDRDLIQLAMYLAKMLIDHPNITLVPEAKSTGVVLISLICAELWKKEINPFTRIYNQVFQNRSAEPYCKIDISTVHATEGPTKKYLGYKTAGSGEHSRDALYKLTLNKALSINAPLVRDKDLISELKSLTLTDKGRIDHTATTHDDCVIAALLGYNFVIHGKNLHLYGIPNHLKLSRVSSDGASLDITKSVRQRQLAIKITELERQISTTTDTIVRMSLSRERNFLKSQLESLGPEIHSMPSVGDMQQVKTQGVTHHDVLQHWTGHNNHRHVYHENFKKFVSDPFRKRDSDSSNPFALF